MWLWPGLQGAAYGTETVSSNRRQIVSMVKLMTTDVTTTEEFISPHKSPLLIAASSTLFIVEC